MCLRLMLVACLALALGLDGRALGAPADSPGRAPGSFPEEAPAESPRAPGGPAPVDPFQRLVEGVRGPVPGFSGAVRQIRRPGGFRLDVDGSFLGGIAEARLAALLQPWFRFDPDARVAEFLEALELRSLDTVRVEVRGARKMTRVEVRIAFAEDSAWGRLLPLENGLLDRPRFVPAGSVLVSRSRFHLGAFWDAAGSILAALHPVWADAAAAWLRRQAAEGVDLRRAFVESLAPAGYTACFPVPSAGAGDGSEGLARVAVHRTRGSDEPARVGEQVLVGLARGRRIFEVRERFGVPVLTSVVGVPAFHSDAVPVRWSAACPESLVILGTGPGTNSLDPVLEALQGAMPSFWDRPEARALPDSAAATLWVDAPRFVELGGLGERLASTGAGGAGGIRDWAEALGRLTAVVRRAPGRLECTVIMLRSE